MLEKNLRALRKRFKLSQEQLAEKINVSRQTIAKWESGEIMPDIKSCIALAELYDLTLDNLVNYSDEVDNMGIPPKVKHIFGFLKNDENGCICIPEKAREIFNIKAGDNLLLLGDEVEGGLALIRESAFMEFISECLKANE